MGIGLALGNPDYKSSALKAWPLCLLPYSISCILNLRADLTDKQKTTPCSPTITLLRTLTFFSGFFTQLHKLRSLRRSFLHFQKLLLLVYLTLDCEQSLFFFRFRERSARARVSSEKRGHLPDRPRKKRDCS